MKVTLALLFIGLAVTTAGPLHKHKHHRRSVAPSGQCAQRCTGTQSKYAYSVGHSYIYELDATTSVQLAEYAAHDTNVTQRARLTLSVHAPCEYELKVDALTISGAETPASFAADVAAHPLRFAMDDGRITAVCPSADESVWVLNMKRSILSALQNAFEADEMKVQEDDVSGECQSTYKRTKQGDDWLYVREKHVHSCRAHHNIHGSLRAQAYDADSDIQTAPLSNAGHECRHKVNARGILQSADCSEWHKFTPFTNNELEGGIVKSTTNMKIAFKSQSDSVTAPSVVGERQSLAYDNSDMHYSQMESATPATASDALKQLCETSAVSVAKETPALFIRLVKSLRNLGRAPITQLISASRTTPVCPRHQQFLMDALPMCGSDACVEAMVDILKTSELSDCDQSAWYMSLAFVPRASLDMVKAVVPLVEKDQAHKRGLLGVSSLVHTYCSQNADCAQEAPVKQLVSRLNALLGQDCKLADEKDASKIEQMIIVLKALGNIGHIGENSVEKLIACAQSRTNPISIRVAAVQALRRTPCEHSERSKLMQLYRSSSVDVEVRISAFLVVVKCPTRALLDEVSEQLSAETVKQVGSFVWSYLNEMRNSDDPTQSPLRSLLRDTRISRRFDLDPRRYSRYMHKGQFVQSTNTGAHVEASTVFVPGSHTPRAGHANITVHMFGHSVNLFEFGARAEGLDHFVEDLLGPDGMLSAPGKSFGEKQANAIDAEYAELSEQNKRRPHYEARERLAVSMYARVFGDELFYHGFDDANVMETVRAKSDYQKLTQFLATQRQYEMSKNVIFLDFTKTLPTMTGVPLRVSITGAASLNLHASGRADLTQLLRRPHNVHIESTLRPSAAIELSTTLSIGVGQGVRSGVRLVSRMHTDTSMHSQLVAQDGKLLRATWAVPQDKQTVMDMEFTGYALVNDVAKEIVSPTEYTPDTFCTPDAFNHAVGLRTCIGYSTPSQPGHLFPRRAWMNLDKTDATLEKYELTLETAGTSPLPMPRRFTFDTPGSQVVRRVVVAMEEDADGSSVLNVQVPNRKYSVKGYMQPSSVAGEHRGQMTLKVDDRDNYTLDGVLKTTGTGMHRRSEFTATATVPDREPIVFTAHYDMQGMSKIDAALNVKGIDTVDTHMSAKINVPTTNGDKFIIALHSACSRYDTKLEIESLHEPNQMIAKLIAEHKSVRGEYEPVTLRFDWQGTVVKSGDMTTTSRKLELTKSVHPMSNFRITADTQQSPNGGEMRTVVKYGDGLAKQMSLTLQRRKDESGKWQIDGELDAEQLGVQQKLKAKYANEYPRMVHVSVHAHAIAGGDDKSVEITLQQPHYGKPDNWEWDGNVEVKYEAKKVNWRLYKQIKQMSAHDFKSKTIVQWKTDHQLEVNGDVKLEKGAGANMHYAMDGTVKITGVADEYRIHKTVNIAGRTMKYAARLERGEHKIYDGKLEVNGEDEQKMTFATHFESHSMYAGRFEVNGNVQQGGRSRQVHIDVKRDSTQLAQLVAAIPKQFGASEDIHTKLHITWDMDKEQKKLHSEYTLTHTGAAGTHDRRHEWTAVAKVNDKEHKWQSVIVRNGHYSMNSTYSQNDKAVIVAHWGMQRAGAHKHTVDAGLKTSAPLVEQDYTGEGLLSTAVGDLHLKLDGRCNIRNERVGGELRYKNEAEGVYEVLIDVEAINAGLHREHKWTRTQDKFEFYSNTRVRWAADQQITQVVNVLKEGKTTKVSSKLVTPFEQLRDFELKYERRCESDVSCINSGLVTMNSEQKLKVHMDTMRSADNGAVVERNIKITTNRDSIGEINGKYTNTIRERDGMTERDFESSISWAEHNKLRVHRLYAANSDYTKLEFSAMAEATVAAVVNTKARYGYKQHQKKHTVEGHLKRDADDYKVTAEFDEESADGTVKVQTPHDALKTAAIKVTRKDDGEYEISTTRNGEEGVQLVGSIKAKAHHRAAHFKVDNVPTPFEIDAEMDYSSDADRKLKLIITKNYALDTAEPYGVHMVTSPGRKALTLLHPRRRPHFEWRRADNEWQLWAQADVKDAAEPTKLIGRHENGYSLTLSDPRLASSVTVSGKAMKVDGACPDGVHLRSDKGPAHACRGDHVQMTLLYSSDEQSRMNIDLFTLHGDGKQRHVEVKAAHPSLGYMQRWYVTLRDDAAQTTTIEAGVDSKRDATSELKKFSVQAVHNPSTHAMNIKLQSPMCASTVHFEHDAATNERRIVFVNDATQQTSWVVAITSDMSDNKRKHQFEVRRQATADVVFHASQDMPNEQTVEALVWHKDGENRRAEDVLVRLWLDESNLMKLRLHVSPQVGRDIINRLKSADAQAVVPTNDSNMFVECVSSNVAHYSQMSKDLSDLLTPMVDGWKVETERVRTDFGTSGVLESVIDYYELAREFLMAQLDVVELTLKDWTKSDSFNKWRKNVHEMKKSMEWAVEEVAIGSTHALAAMRTTLAEIVAQLKESYEKVERMMNDNSFITDVKNSISQWTDKVKGATNYEQFREQMHSAVKSVSQSSAIDTAVHYWDSFMGFSLMRGLYTVVEPAIDELVTYDVKEIISRLFDYIRDMIDGHSKLSEYLPKVTYYKPDEGQVELQFPLPVRASSLADLMSQIEPTAVQRYFEEMIRKISDIISTDGQISQDLWQWTGSKPSSNKQPTKDDLAPQHQATGLVGSGAVVSFDGSSYLLPAGDCEYLLAKDLVNNKFTITAAIVNGNIDVLRVKCAGDAVEIHKNGKMMVNGAQSTMPWQHMDTFEGTATMKVIRRDHSIELETAEGIKVMYDMYNQLATVALPGYFHGQTNGLMGTNDLEPSNDMALPDGNENDDVVNFVKSFVVRGKKCSLSATAVSDSESRKLECDNLFRMRQSPLRSCFARVAPRAYHQLCMNAADKCNATAAYATACKAQGVEVLMPSECLTCRKSESSASDTIVGGEETQVMSRHVGADIVYVIEERPCMAFVKERLTQGNAGVQIIAGLEHLGKDVQVGVIGYGGEEVHNSPHFHTDHTGAVHIARPEGVKEAINSLTFTAESAMAENVPVVDPLTAIDFAVKNYPFRPTVAKTIVLFACTECGSDADYYAVQQALLSHNIQLHVFTTQMIELNAPLADSVELLGFSADNVYTSAGERAESRASLASPHDSCTVLAQEVGGSVWTVHDEGSAVLAIPIKTMTAKVAQAHAATSCFVCECEAFEFSPRTSCQTCEVPVPMSLTGRSFFNVPYIKLLKKAKQQLGAVDAWLI